MKQHIQSIFIKFDTHHDSIILMGLNIFKKPNLMSFSLTFLQIYYPRVYSKRVVIDQSNEMKKVRSIIKIVLHLSKINKTSSGNPFTVLFLPSSVFEPKDTNKAYGLSLLFRIGMLWKELTTISITITFRFPRYLYIFTPRRDFDQGQTQVLVSAPSKQINQSNVFSIAQIVLVYKLQIEMQWNCQNCKKGIKKGNPCPTCSNRQANWACTTCHMCNPKGNNMKKCGAGSNPAYWWYSPKGNPCKCGNRQNCWRCYNCDFNNAKGNPCKCTNRENNWRCPKCDYDNAQGNPCKKCGGKK